MWCSALLCHCSSGEENVNSVQQPNPGFEPPQRQSWPGQKGRQLLGNALRRGETFAGVKACSLAGLRQPIKGFAGKTHHV